MVQHSLIPELVHRFVAQANERSSLSVQAYVAEYRGLKVQASFGKGNFARVPWMALLAKGQAPFLGIYPVLLYFRAQQRLLLCFGVSEEMQASDRWEGLKGRPTVRDWFKEYGLGTPPRYGSSLMAAAWDTSKPLPLARIALALDQVIDEYLRVLATNAQA